MTKILSELYNATFKKIRGKASEGFIRPTLSEFFISNKDFQKIPIIKSWYELYGPSGTNDVIQIGSVYYTRANNSAGAYYGNTLSRQFNQISNYVENLNWLEKDDWRLPTKSELSVMYANKDIIELNYWEIGGPIIDGESWMMRPSDGFFYYTDGGACFRVVRDVI